MLASDINKVPSPFVDHLKNFEPTYGPMQEIIYQHVEQSVLSFSNAIEKQHPEAKLAVTSMAPTYYSSASLKMLREMSPESYEYHLKMLVEHEPCIRKYLKNRETFAYYLGAAVVSIPLLTAIAVILIKGI